VITPFLLRLVRCRLELTVNRYAPGARQEMLSRSIRIKQVPDGTQEPILQQALEKIAPVSKVHLLPDENAAVVELAHVAVSI
jgi:hypothetical protein